MELRNLDWFNFFIKHSLKPEQALLLTEYAQKLESNSVPVIFEVEHLSKLLGIELSLISRMICANSLFYRPFQLKKRSGGIRVIESPYPKLAYVQQWIKSYILDSRAVSDKAFAYVKGTSHIENAKRHVGAKELLKIDLVDFFGHIKFNAIKAIFTDCGYSDKVSHQLTKLCTYWDKLPQGAPTSPSISNIVFLELDNLFMNISKDYGLIYTRYADDLCFSGDIITDDFYSIIRGEIETKGFVVNEQKSRVVRGNQRKLITGLIVSDNEIRVPKKMRREYRKQSYYLVKNGIAQFNGDLGVFNPFYIDEVIGKGQYIISVEPNNNYVKESLNLLLKLKNELLVY